MMRLFTLTALLLLPIAATAKESAPEDYGMGLICPHSDTQIMFYTENNQQDASGTIAYDSGNGFIITSNTVKDLKSAGGHVMEGLCDNNAPGIRIDTKRDGWMQAGTLWLPPTQDWDYGDWADYLRKTAVWKPVTPPILYQGGPDGPEKNKLAVAEPTRGGEIYPLKYTDDNSFALVVVDESGAYAKSCAGSPTLPKGRVGWMALVSDDGKPTAVPLHAKLCEVDAPTPPEFRSVPEKYNEQ